MENRERAAFDAAYNGETLEGFSLQELIGAGRFVAEAPFGRRTRQAERAIEARIKAVAPKPTVEQIARGFAVAAEMTYSNPERN